MRDVNYWPYALRLREEDLAGVRRAMRLRCQRRGYLCITHAGTKNTLEQRWPDEVETVIRRRQRLAS